jgi:hypothetical protein
MTQPYTFQEYIAGRTNEGQYIALSDNPFSPISWNFIEFLNDPNRIKLNQDDNSNFFCAIKPQFNVKFKLVSENNNFLNMGEEYFSNNQVDSNSNRGGFVSHKVGIWKDDELVFWLRKYDFLYLQSEGKAQVPPYIKDITNGSIPKVCGFVIGFNDFDGDEQIDYGYREGVADDEFFLELLDVQKVDGEEGIFTLDVIQPQDGTQDPQDPTPHPQENEFYELIGHQANYTVSLSFNPNTTANPNEVYLVSNNGDITEHSDYEKAKTYALQVWESRPPINDDYKDDTKKLNEVNWMGIIGGLILIGGIAFSMVIIFKSLKGDE